MKKSVGKAINIIGNRYGMLTVIERADDYILKNGKIKTRWKCLCDCGNEIIVMKNALSSGTTKSCGCLRNNINSHRLKKNNKYVLSGKHGIGYDSKNNEFYFDLEDYEKIKDCYWFVNEKGYVMNSKNQSMHRLLCESFDVVDHVNHKKFDNRKCNLRDVTNQQNVMNSKLQVNNTSGITGVTWHKNDMKWQAQITLNGRCIYLGSYTNKDDAIKVRRDAENKYFGKYSYNNSIHKEENDVNNRK